jgi:hypothetical protein
MDDFDDCGMLEGHALSPNENEWVRLPENKALYEAHVRNALSEQDEKTLCSTARSGRWGKMADVAEKLLAGQETLVAAHALLMICAAEEHLQVVVALARPEVVAAPVPNCGGKTALMRAAEKGNHGETMFLIGCCDPLARDENGADALMLAEEVDVIETLASASDVDRVDRMGRGAMDRAVEESDMPRLVTLLKMSPSAETIRRAISNLKANAWRADEMEAALAKRLAEQESVAIEGAASKAENNNRPDPRRPRAL